MQKPEKKYRNLFISLAIAGVLVLLSYLFFYPDRSGLGSGFSVAIVYMIVRYAALYAGGIVLLARLAKLLKKTDGLLYVLPGTINFLVGALCLILYFQGDADRPWLYKCLGNLAIGLFILADAFLFHKVTNTSERGK